MDLERLRKLARTGWRKPAENKYNEFRARWLFAMIKHNKPAWEHENYFRHEYKAMPEALKQLVEGRVLA